MPLTATSEIDIASPGGDLAALKAAITALVLLPTLGAPYVIDNYIDAANGIMADTLAFRAAIAAAGVGGEVRGKPGTLYTLYGSVKPLFGQRLIGNLAEIKRCDAITTTTTTGVTSGVSNTVTVASAANFRVGMDIAIKSSATVGTSNVRITAINGNVITTAAVFDATIASGATLTTSFSQISNGVAGDNGPVYISGWEFDGNKANNAGFTSWMNHCEINISGRGACAEHNYVHDAQHEGIYVFAGDGSGDDSPNPYVVQHNIIDRCNGNGIHMSAATSGKANYNTIRNTNIRVNGASGHNDGGIAFSFNGPDWQVVGNVIENDPIAGIGGLGQYPYGAEGIIAHNTIRNCATPIGIKLNGAAGGRVTIHDNRFISSGVWTLQQTGSYDPAYGLQEVLVHDNLFADSRLLVGKCRNVKSHDNQFYSPSDVTNILFAITAGAVGVQATDNTFVGGNYGIYCDGASTDRIRIAGNDFLNQKTNGVTCLPATPTMAVVENNKIVVEAGYAAAAAYNGIVLGNSVVARGNDLNIGVASTSYGIVCPTGGTGVRGATVTGNTIVAPSMAGATRCFGGSKNNTVVGNFSNQAFSNGGGTDNIVTPNYALSTV